MKETTFITTPDRVMLELELAGPVSRFSAWLIDQVIIQLILLAVILIFLSIGVLTAFELEDLFENAEVASAALAVLVLLYFIIYWGYSVFWELALRGQTPGKRWMGLRVVREDGLPVGVREVVLRNLVRAADMMPPPFYVVGAVAMNFDPQGRRLGDMVAGTLVIRELLESRRGTRAGAAWAARAEQGQARQGVLLPRGALPSSYLALIEQFLERRGTFGADRREALARRLLDPIKPLLDEETVSRLERATLTAEQVLGQVVELARAQAAGQVATTTKQPEHPALF